MSALLGIVEDIGIRQQLLEVFSNVENGTPDNISKFGCLALAKKGAVVWNAWRKAFPVIEHELIVGDFTNFADFRDLEIQFSSFAGFHFGDATNFTGTKFRGSANFIDAKFDRETTFEKAVFYKEARFGNAEFFNANFKDTVFLKSASFSQAKFSEDAFFYGTTFTKVASFIKTEFNEVSFEDAVFKARAEFFWTKFQKQDNFIKRDVSFCNTTFNYVAFDNAQFLFEVDFKEAKFKSAASFDKVIFGFSFYLSEIKFSGPVSFKGACFPNRTTFQDITFEKNADFDGEDLNKLPDMLEIKTIIDAKGLAPNDFLQIKFLGCEFKEEANFSNRIFKNSCIFGTLQKRDNSDNLILQKTTFAKAPKFHNCELHQDTSFDGAEFPEATGNEESARAYRTLKLAFNKMQGVREEQKFFRLEIAEEAKSAIGIRKFLFSIYEKLSDYGFDFCRPIRYLTLSIIGFGLIFGALSLFTQCSINFLHLPSTNEHVISNCHFSPKWFEFVVVQALPIPGLDKISENAKSEIFSNNAWLSLIITLLVIVQKSLSLLFLFFIGLALKNQFKFK